MATLTAQPHITVSALPVATPGQTETATVSVTNVGTEPGRWIVRGAIYDQAGRSIGSYVSKSIDLNPGVAGSVQLTTTGPISSAFAGSWVGVVFTAASASTNSASSRTEEYRLHVAPLSVSAPPPVSTSPPASSTSTAPPSTIPWYENLWDNHKPEVIGVGVAVVLVGGGLAYGHYLQRHPK